MAPKKTLKDIVHPKVREDDARGAKPGQSGQPAFEATDEQREKVRLLIAKYGERAVARELEIDRTTLRNHFFAEIEESRAIGTGKAASKLWEAVEKREPWAIKYWLETFGGDEYQQRGTGRDRFAKLKKPGEQDDSDIVIDIPADASLDELRRLRDIVGRAIAQTKPEGDDGDDSRATQH